MNHYNHNDNNMNNNNNNNNNRDNNNNIDKDNNNDLNNINYNHNNEDDDHNVIKHYINNDNNLSIGGYQVDNSIGDSKYLNADLDEIRIYNKSLTQDQVNSLGNRTEVSKQILQTNRVGNVFDKSGFFIISIFLKKQQKKTSSKPS